MRSHRRKRREHDGSQRCRNGCMNDSCIRHAGIDQKQVMKGVAPMPPPIPRRPAKKPVQAPKQSRAATISQDMNTLPAELSKCGVHDTCTKEGRTRLGQELTKAGKGRPCGFRLRCLNRKVRVAAAGAENGADNACPLHYRLSS